jgi:hypothetical protein
VSAVPEFAWLLIAVLCATIALLIFGTFAVIALRTRRTNRRLRAALRTRKRPD